MPIYPYVCTECGHEFDALQKISDDPLSECPACGASGLRKRLAAPAFQLKGTGWYETDFKHGRQDKKDKPADGKDEQAGKDKGAEASGREGESDKSQAETKGESKGSTSGGEKKPAAAAGGNGD